MISTQASASVDSLMNNAIENTDKAKKDDQKYNPKEELTDSFDEIKSQLNVDKEALA